MTFSIFSCFLHIQPAVFQALSSPQQSRHPERSASRIYRVTRRFDGAESKDPEDAYLAHAVRSFPTTEAREQDLAAVLVEKILQSPDVGEPLQVVTGVLSEFDWESLGSRNSQRQRQAVIAANPEQLDKHHSIAVAFIDALRQRGVGADIARLPPTSGFNCFLRLTYIGLRH